MSAFGKIFAPITVGTGGWTFGFMESAAHRTVTIPAATYDTILELLTALDDALDVSYTPTITISAVGIISIQIAEMTADDWAATDGEFEQLGFALTETISGTTLTATYQHWWGWYPGVLTFGASGGVGLEADTEWMPVEVSDGIVSGAGELAIIAPTRPPYERQLAFGAISRAEMRDRNRGPICLRDRWRTKVLRWYPDRDITPGTQGDPGSPYYDTDADCSYYEVTVRGEPTIERHAGHPDWFNVRVRLNAEPIL